MNIMTLKSSLNGMLSRLPLQRCMRALLIAAAVLMVTGCGGGTDVGPGRTEIVVGALYYEDGTPAEKVTVKFVRMQDEPLSRVKYFGPAKVKYETYYTVTSKNGMICLNDTLDDGYYRVLGGMDHLQSFSDSVKFTAGNCEDTLSDTLKNTGSITGKLRMRYPDHDPRSILILVPGFGIYTVRNSDGEFLLENLPEGEVYVAFASQTNDYLFYDTTLTIIAGVNDTLDHPIEPPYVGYLIIKGMNCMVDTLRRSVRITWDELPDERVFGYEIMTQSYANITRPVIFRIQADSLPEDITLYLEDSMAVRIRPVDNNQLACGDFAPRIMVRSPNLHSFKTVCKSVDSIGAHGMALRGDTIFMLASLYYGYQEVVVRKLLISGAEAGVVELEGDMVAPVDLAITASDLYILDRKTDDSLCLHVYTGDSVAHCMSSIPLVNAQQFVSASHLSVSPQGNVYVSADQTIYELDSAGNIGAMVNRMLPYFATSPEGLYGFSKSRPFELLHMDSNLKETSGIRFEDTTVYKNFELSLIRGIAVRNGLVCVLKEQSLYVFNVDINEVARINIYNWMQVVDMQFAGDNLLYVLYADGKIESVDLTEMVSRLN